jgi:DNA-binding transcriptional MocR family regulator
LTAFFDLPSGVKLMLGNGSDELIDLLSVACDVPGAVVLAPLPGFVMYQMSARLRGLRFEGVPLTADFELDGPAMLAAIERHQPALTYIAYPNNPTANLFDESTVQSVVDAVGAQRGLVVIDEAQRAPQMFPVLRVLADRQGQPATFLILGSASPELSRQASESLAGRVEIIEMGGFGLDELSPEDRQALWLRGGFPPGRCCSLRL